ncbi:hypothetical protein EJ07DRAFT_157872 [Lizonia empirigonia]|nr:hypothetical protein EJ07DRAFT_157872 [Lizonia empirigonia]
MATTEGADKKDSWHTRSSAQGHTSVTWWRPILALIPITAKYRKDLIGVKRPRVRCLIEGFQRLDLHVATAATIWRYQLGLCPERDFYHEDPDTEYPVGSEERVITWTRDIGACESAIVFLDLLPVVVIEEKNTTTTVDLLERRQSPVLLWYRQEEVIARRKASSQGLIRQSAYGTVEEPTHRQEQEVPQPPSANPVLMKAGQLRGTGAEVQKPDVEFTPATLRRRATKTDTKRPSDPNLRADKKKRGAVGQWLDDLGPQSSPSPPLSGRGASTGPRAPPSVHQSTLNHR